MEKELSLAMLPMSGLLFFPPQSEFEQQHAEDVAGGFIQEYEGAEATTRKALKNSGKVCPSPSLLFASCYSTCLVNAYIHKREAVAESRTFQDPGLRHSHETTPLPRRTFAAYSRPMYS